MMPTIPAPAGMPVAEDFDGQVLLDAISTAFLAKNPIRTIKLYGAGHEFASLNTDLGPETRRKLQSLGWLQ